MKTEDVVKHLKRLESLRILDYAPRTDKPLLVFLQERLDLKDIRISQANYNDRLKENEERLEAMIRYATSDHQCRSQLLVGYFGECNTKRCGKCDVCIERNKISLNEMEFDNILARIKPLLKSGSCTLEELVCAAEPVHEDKVIRAIQWLVDNEKITVNADRTYEWKTNS